MTRLNILDVKETVMNMCDGNPGGLTAMLALVEATPKIDPDALFGNVSPLVWLDELKIYGSSIWILYKDICGQDITKTLAVLRGYQLDLLSRNEIMSALTEDYHSDAKNVLRTKVENIVEQVKQHVPTFGNS